MALTVTNQTKNAAITITNESKDDGLIWNDAVWTWDEAAGTWAVPKIVITKDSKNNLSVSNESKN